MRYGFFAQRFHLIRGFPGDALFGAAKMPECRGVAVDRPPQLQVFDDAPRGEREMRANQRGDFVFGTMPVPKVLAITETGSATPMA